MKRPRSPFCGFVPDLNQARLTPENYRRDISHNELGRSTGHSQHAPQPRAPNRDGDDNTLFDFADFVTTLPDDSISKVNGGSGRVPGTTKLPSKARALSALRSYDVMSTGLTGRDDRSYYGYVENASILPYREMVFYPQSTVSKQVACDACKSRTFFSFLRILPFGEKCGRKYPHTQR